MDRRNEDTALLALRGGLRGRFRRSFDSMENAFEVLQDRLQHAVNPAERAELTLLEELQTQLICLRRLGDQASDAATAALLHGTCVPQPIDLLGQLREFCSILQEEAAQYALPFTVTVQADGLDVLPTTGDVSLLNGLLTNLVSNTLAADRAAHIMLLCTPGRLCYRDNGPGLPPDAAALLTEGQWSERLLHAGGLGLPLVSAYTSAMGWALTVGEGPGMSLQFTLPAAPPLDGMVLTSPTERLADRQNRHGKHQYAHAAYPVGKAAPEQHTVTHGFHIAQDAGAGGGKAGYRFKKGIYKKRDIAADDKRQRTEHGHQHPGQCNDHKTLARIDYRVGGAAQPQNKAQHGQPHRRYHKGKQAAPLAINNSYNRRRQQQGGFNHKNTAQHIPKHAVVHSVTPLP